MLSEEAKDEMRRAAASPALRADFAAMAANARRAGRAMSVDDVLAFLTAMEKMFGGAPRKARAHKPYPRALI